jgi:N-dimethylarginine dimethylaminohydrolase
MLNNLKPIELRAAVGGMQYSTPQILMCAPTYFSVDYEINPWMQGNHNGVDAVRAESQWQALRYLISCSAEVALLEPRVSLPDMVFTANAALLLGNKAIVSTFRHAERRGEEKFFSAWFARNGFEIHSLTGLAFEGAGDALLDRAGQWLWFGHGHRSDAAVAEQLRAILDVEVVSLQLIDSRFYHLDTCLCPLTGGHLMYYPGAFDEAAQAAITQRVPPELRIEVSEQDALRFACNAVNIGDTIILHRATAELQDRLGEAGYFVKETPLLEFLKSGGSAKCLTLRLDEPVAGRGR